MRFFSIFFLRRLFFENLFQFLFSGFCDFCRRELRIKDHRRLCFFCLLKLSRELRDFAAKNRCHLCVHPLINTRELVKKRSSGDHWRFSFDTIGQINSANSFVVDKKKKYFCPACAITLLKVDEAQSLFANEKWAQRLCYDYKFLSHFSYAHLLAKWILLYYRHFFLSYDVVVVVAQSAQSLYKKGFCQVTKVMKIVAKELFLPVSQPIKCRGLSAQHFLSWRERQKQVKSRFIYQNKEKSAFDGKRVLIVDDICTSGATINHFVDLIRKNNKIKGIGAFYFARSILNKEENKKR